MIRQKTHCARLAEYFLDYWSLRSFDAQLMLQASIVGVLLGFDPDALSSHQAIPHSRKP